MRVCFLIVLFFLSGAAVEGAVDQDILNLVQQVASERIDSDVKRLVAFETRFMGSDSNAAASVWLGERLAGLGYVVRYDTFEVKETNGTNHIQNILYQDSEWKLRNDHDSKRKAILRRIQTNELTAANSTRLD